MHHRAVESSTSFKMLQYGSQATPVKLNLVSGEATTLPNPGRYSVMQYISKEASRTEQSILYAQYLSRSRPNDSVKYVLVVNPEAKPLIEHLKHLTIPNLNVAIDVENRYVNSMGLPMDSDSTIALDGNGIVQFSSLGLILPDTLRILYARYSGSRESSGADEQMPPFRLGEQLPPFQVRDLRIGRDISSTTLFALSPRPLWIFTAECAMCSLPGYLRRLSNVNGPMPIPIFSSRVPLPLLMDFVSDTGYKGPLYQAVDEIPVFEDLYHNKSLTPYASSVHLSTDGHIEKVELISPFE